MLPGIVLIAGMMTEATYCQQVVLRKGGLAMQPQASRTVAQVDDGRLVEMYESPNLDRFLRRARQFLDEEKYQEAIQVLQSVIEGRTLVANQAPADNAAADAEPGRPAEDKPIRPGPESAEGRRLADPAQTVFSEDGRIYRPARRLCHEYLAGMPAVGLTLYRTRYEALAQEALAQALFAGDVSSLEGIANKYFVTLAAGQAMRVLADRHMHEGRYRAAVQVLRDLIELYPDVSLRKLSISKLWCQFKIALCLRLAGETAAALDAVRELAEQYPDESLRVMGELQPVSTLDESPMFAPDDATLVGAVGGPRRGDDLSWLEQGAADLVPLWQYRFAGDNPYAKPKSRSSNERVFFIGESQVVNTAPYASKYGTGTQLAFVGPGSPAPLAVFLEHYRLRVASAFTGLLLDEGDGVVKPPRPHDGRPRARVPVYDFALQRPIADESNYYVITGYSKTTQGVEALKKNRIVAYDRETCERVWCSDDFREGEDSYEDVTFLASPTVFGERLLAPVLQRGAYMLQCSDRKTGAPLWRTRIHAGGSEFYKSPGTPVVMSGTLAYILTNAGAVAAVDAFAGDIKWVRKYERSDPLRPTRTLLAGKRQGRRFSGSNQFREQDLKRYLPSLMFANAGTLVLAGCDSRMLLCLDGSSGEPLWMIDGTTRFAPYGNLRYLVGMNSRYLYASSDSDLVAIELASGLIKWAQPLPADSDKLTRWRGRGCVLEDFVLMPGDRELLVMDTDGSGPWRRIQLPSFSIADDPLQGPNNIYSSGPWLGIAYATGIEVYSTADALLTLANDIEDPSLQVTYLVQAGRLEAGIEVMTEWLSSLVDQPDMPAADRTAAEVQLVSLARELAMKRGTDGMAVLDGVDALVTDRNARMQWYLARIDLLHQIQDLTAYPQEQQRLYRYMEGKEQ